MNPAITVLTLVLSLGLASALRAENPIKDVEPKEAATLLAETKDITAVDVRTPLEFGDGHIAKAKNINVMDDDFKAQVAKLDPAKPVLVYCKSGGRSSRALMTFRELGFQLVYHLKDGLMSWEDAGLEIEE
tara:strand:+ start:47 stop:439 length:393 start_codon:yes stop_codon:yes gene_type:complete